MLGSFQNTNSYGLAGEKSRLFYEYARIKEEVQPTYFLLENVKMRKQAEEQLNKFLKINGLHINSSTMSIQSRHRIYWTNIKDFRDKKTFNSVVNNIPQPNNKTLRLKKTNKPISVDLQDYLIKTLPKYEQMLYIKKYPMCYSLFSKEEQLQMNSYIEKDGNENIINVNFDIENIPQEDIEKNN